MSKKASFFDLFKFQNVLVVTDAEIFNEHISEDTLHKYSPDMKGRFKEGDVIMSHNFDSPLVYEDEKSVAAVCMLQISKNGISINPFTGGLVKEADFSDAVTPLLTIPDNLFSHIFDQYSSLIHDGTDHPSIYLKPEHSHTTPLTKEYNQSDVLNAITLKYAINEMYTQLIAAQNTRGVKIENLLAAPEDTFSG